MLKHIFPKKLYEKLTQLAPGFYRYSNLVILRYIYSAIISHITAISHQSSLSQ